MLPFLKPKNMATTIIENRSKGKSEVVEDAPADMVKMAEDMISAIHAKDATRLAAILHSMHESEDIESPDQE